MVSASEVAQSPNTMQQDLPTASAQTLLWAGLDYQHPQATHQILIRSVGARDSVRVAYRLERSARKSIGFQVGAKGLSIRAPRWVTQAQLEAAIHEKSHWILQKLQIQWNEVQQATSQPLQWMQGAELPYLGGLLRLHLSPDAPRGGALQAIEPDVWSLHLPVPTTASVAQIRAAVSAWWLRHARDVFTQRLQHFAPQFGVCWRSLRLSNARTRWGSAKSDGSIMLNWRLLHCRMEVLDYVVAHELAHLRVMDHSPRFWAVVSEVVPEYAVLRAELRKHVSPVWN